jgi:peptide/nickel transport system permease protein
MTAAAATADKAQKQTAPATASRGYWSGVLHRLMRNQLAMICLAILLLIVLAAIFAPYIAPQDPYRGAMLRRLRPIGTPGYPLGTDELGRDMLTRLLYGGRLSLFIGIVPVLNAFVIGTALGVIAGFVGGKTNMAIMRTIDVFYAFPSVLLAIAISGALGAGILNSIISLTVVFVPPLARVAESVTTQTRSLDFVDATSLVSVSMILAAGLSFLGLGVKPPEAEWGLMLNTLRTAIYSQPYVAALPGAMIFAVSICFNLFSDALRSAMDVKV